jgi:hypothetical protein
MPRPGPIRPAAECGRDRSLQAAAHADPGRTRVWVRSTGALRDTRSFLVPWGMGMKRLVLLVVDYLCHVIVHFSGMFEIGGGYLRETGAGGI